jgi:hypothetical protein
MFTGKMETITIRLRLQRWIDAGMKFNAMKRGLSSTEMSFSGGVTRRHLVTCSRVAGHDNLLSPDNLTNPYSQYSASIDANSSHATGLARNESQSAAIKSKFPLLFRELNSQVSDTNQSVTTQRNPPTIDRAHSTSQDTQPGRPCMNMTKLELNKAIVTI